MRNWAAGLITATLILAGIALQCFVSRTLDSLQIFLVVFSYYGMLTMALCLIFKNKGYPGNEFYRPFVSILVPAKNEEKVIEATVRSLAELNYRKNNKPNYEIIIIDDSSTDATPLILEKLSKEIPMLHPVRRLPGEGNPGKSAVLNHGLKYVTGEVVAVFDADTRVEPDFLKKSIPLLYAPEVGGVQGRVRICNAHDNILTQLQDDEFSTYAHMVQLCKEFYGGINILAGNGQITKRSALLEVGGWNELSATDDLDLTIKLLLKGKAIRYAPDASLWQEGITTLKPFFRQRVRWAEGMLKCCYDYLYPLLLTRGIPLVQKLDSITVLARILIPITIWIGYTQFLCTYFFYMPFTSGFPAFFMDSLPWIFSIVMSGGLLKYVAGANPVTLIRVPIYWLYNLGWVITMPIGYYNCIKHYNCIEWDKTQHHGLGKAPAACTSESPQVSTSAPR